MATYTRYVDCASTAGGDGTSRSLTGSTRAFASLSEAEATCQTQRSSTLNATDILNIICCNSDTGNCTDTTSFAIDGWTITSGGQFNILADESHGGKWNSNKYRMEVTLAGSDYMIWIKENGVSVTGIQMKITSSVSDGNSACINVSTTIAVACTIKVSKCIFKGVLSSVSNASGTDGSGINPDVYFQIENCIAYDFIGGSGSTRGGFRGRKTSGAAATYYNCTAHNCYFGFYVETSGLLSATNCGAADCTTGFHANVSQTTCSSTTPTFVNKDADDFHLGSGDTAWSGQGTNLSAQFTTDIDGETRIVPWSIGADQLNPKAVVTGTATGSITESDVRTGGKTIVITLTGTTWVPS